MLLTTSVFSGWFQVLGPSLVGVAEGRLCDVWNNWNKIGKHPTRAFWLELEPRRDRQTTLLVDVELDMYKVSISRHISIKY